MASATPTLPAPTRSARMGRRAPVSGALALRGSVGLYLGLLVALPVAALLYRSQADGWGHFWSTVTDPQTVAALQLTVGLSALVVVVNAVLGTLVAWVLVRDPFPGRRLVDAVIDLPFALPTIVSGLVLLALYGPGSPIGVDVAYTRTAITLALLFITLPFVVRAVQPVLEAMDLEAEEAARSLGASPFTTFRRIVLPALSPAVLAGAGLGFARALGEFGSLVLLAGNLPFRTEMSSVRIVGLLEQDDPAGAAALSIVLLGAALAGQIVFTLVRRWSLRHDG